MARLCAISAASALESKYCLESQIKFSKRDNVSEKLIDKAIDMGKTVRELYQSFSINGFDGNKMYEETKRFFYRELPTGMNTYILFSAASALEYEEMVEWIIFNCMGEEGGFFESMYIGTYMKMLKAQSVLFRLFDEKIGAFYRPRMF